MILKDKKMFFIFVMIIGFDKKVEKIVDDIYKIVFDDLIVYIMGVFFIN